MSEGVVGPAGGRRTWTLKQVGPFNPNVVVTGAALKLGESVEVVEAAGGRWTEEQVQAARDAAVAYAKEQDEPDRADTAVYVLHEFHRVDAILKALEAAGGTPEGQRYEQDRPMAGTDLNENADFASEADLRAPHQQELMLTAADFEVAIKAIQDVWVMQADDEPNPNAATLAWRRFRAAASGPPGGEG